MKRTLTISLCLMFITIPSFAKNVSDQITNKNYAYSGVRHWNLDQEGDSYSVTNISDHKSSFKIIVNAKIEKTQLDADPLYFICHGMVSTITAGASANCTIAPHEFFGFKILPGKFKNGSEGTYFRYENK